MIGLFLFLGAAFAIDAHGFAFHGLSGDVEEYARMGYPTAGVFGDWDISLVADYARDPLTEQTLDGRVSVMPALGTTTLNGAFSFGGLKLEGSLPYHALGTDPSGNFSALGDARVGALVPLPWMNPRVPLMAVHAGLVIPTGSEEHFVSSGAIRFEGAGLFAKEFGNIGVMGLLGAVVTRPEEERNLVAGAGPMFGVGASYRAGESLSAALELTGETEYGLTSLPMETTLSARYRVPAGAWATLGGAVGLTDGVGASRWRVFAGVGWSARQAEHVDAVVYAEDTTTDRDGDGIYDRDDICPDQAETVDQFDDTDGCPELDGDQDGVPFARDVCPTQPILRGQDPRYSDGCPRIAELAGDKIVITETIFFEEGKADILPGSERVLKAVYTILQEHPEVGPVMIAGHTNANGSDAFNLRLSDARAYEVMRWLVEAGIEPERLISKGFGEAQPLVAESDPNAEAINRRVEFYMVGSSGIPGDARQVHLSPEELAARAARQAQAPATGTPPTAAGTTKPAETHGETGHHEAGHTETPPTTQGKRKRPASADDHK